MKAVVQRVTEASVTVNGAVTGQIDAGLLVLLGVTHDDSAADAERLAAKIWGLRILRDEQSASDIGTPLLVISQFTLYGDTRKGRRPTWAAAAPADIAQPLYRAFCSALSHLGAEVSEGVFGADMLVTSTNDGPTTVIVEI